MNTNELKRFAQETRRKLMQQVAAKLDFVLTGDTPELRERAEQVKKLKEELKKTSKEQLVDKVAYTWFNRLMALRFMDANDYQPIGVRVISPLPNQTSPELLNQAKQGDIPSELKVDVKSVMDILDGRTTSSNPQNEVFKILLIGACNHLSSVLPFLFERINDYTELLLPDDLTSEFSVVSDIVKEMSEEDCGEVEIIGWLYQFYISEKKDEVFASKSKVKKEDIPAATQLFTPRWIVEYMVQNTVGKLWLQNKPSSKLREHMPYFIESASVQSDDYLKVSSPEEIKLLDQAAGSGHILVYGFELLTKIYEEEGYNPSEIASLIITKNLYGFEIDERASQLAAMAVLMKAREYQRRLFSKDNVPEPNILNFKDLELTSDEIKSNLEKVGIKPSDELLHDLKNMQNATNFGSLILPNAKKSEIENTVNKLSKTSSGGDIFYELQINGLKQAISQLMLLSDKYHCVVDNPPYMGGGNMNKTLADFVKINYPDSKADLMACFMEAGLKVLHPSGYLGMINQHSWMFLSSYDKLREKLIRNTFFDTLLHLGPRTFPEIGGEVVQNASFTFWNKSSEKKGVYLRLVDFNSTELKREKTVFAIQDPDCGWYYKSSQKNFEKIPGSPIGYWIRKNLSDSFLNEKVSDLYDVKTGMQTGNNHLFLRFWSEVEFKLINKPQDNFPLLPNRWFLYSKGGSNRKWYGNVEHIVDWKHDGAEIRNYKVNGNLRSRTREITNYFRDGCSWSFVTSSDFSARFKPSGVFFDVAGSSLFPKKQNNISYEYILGLLATNVCKAVLNILNPTLNFQINDISSIPLIKKNQNIINEIVKKNILISQTDWDSRENSWSFKRNELIKIKASNLEETYDLYIQYWQTKFFQLHKNEEEINRQFNMIYGVEEEVSSDVPLKDITILKEETSIEDEQLIFHAEEVFEQFISYSVGCMFGRYSLEKEGLILANQGETLNDYLEKVELSAEELSFFPDEDNIIPILDDEWFEDDIVGRFHEFLKASFGEPNFRKNLAFVEEQIGDIRKYFVKSFYNDHIKRYKKRPIYWMFSSPKGHFNVLVYMHRYTPDTINNILNNYLREFIEKLKSRKEHLAEIQISGSAAEQTKAIKEIDNLDKMLLDCQEYEREILYKMATERIEIDLDDGVLVNYNKFGKALKEVKGLNDKKAKDKVKKFDWIDVKEIR